MDTTVGSTTRKPLEDAEIQELRRDPSTESIVKEAARTVGVSLQHAAGDGEIAFTAEDKTYDEVIAEKKAVLPPSELGAEAADVGAHVAELFMKRVPKAVVYGVEIGGGLLATGLLVHGYVKSVELGDHAKDAVLQDALHVALLWTLEGLPQGFRDEEIAKRKEVAGGTGCTSAKIATALKANPDVAKCAPVLQRHCDDGIRAAEEVIAAGGRTATAFFDAHPDVAARFGPRYRSDAAFRAGFDGRLWAQRQAEDPRTHDDGPLREMRDGLRERESWFRAASVVKG
jgi:hypothetical protein